MWKSRGTDFHVRSGVVYKLQEQRDIFGAAYGWQHTFTQRQLHLTEKLELVHTNKLKVLFFSPVNFFYELLGANHCDSAVLSDDAKAKHCRAERTKTMKMAPNTHLKASCHSYNVEQLSPNSRTASCRLSCCGCCASLWKMTAELVPEFSEAIQVIWGQHWADALPRTCWQTWGHKEM